MTDCHTTVTTQTLAKPWCVQLAAFCALYVICDMFTAQGKCFPLFARYLRRALINMISGIGSSFCQSKLLHYQIFFNDSHLPKHWHTYHCFQHTDDSLQFSNSWISLYSGTSTQLVTYLSLSVADFTCQHLLSYRHTGG
jgi:hypothetical protein